MKMMFKIIFSAGTALALLAGPVPGLPSIAHAAKGQFFTTEEILADFFPGAESIQKHEIALTQARCNRLQARLGYVPRTPAGVFPVWVGTRGGKVLGYAVIDEEKGMHEPITFAVLVSPDGSVVRQEVLVYREAEGDGVTRKAFRRQFVGKTAKSALRPGVDLTIVTGATISSNSMAVGVRRALAIVSDAFLEAPEATAEHLPGAGL